MGVISIWGGVHFIPDAIFLLYIILLFPLVHESCNLLANFMLKCLNPMICWSNSYIILKYSYVLNFYVLKLFILKNKL